MQKNKISSKKNIPWHHTRWFWGVVVGVVAVLAVKHNLNIDVAIYSNKIYNFLSSLPVGFSVGTPMLTAITIRLENVNVFWISDLPEYGIGIFIALYYLVFLALLFKTFDQKRVKIRYPILFILIIIISVLGISFAGIPS